MSIQQDTKRTKSAVKTEDLGKQFEMALCLLYETPYDGKYKYGMEVPEALKPRLTRVKELFPPCTHTAKKGCRYDYTGVADTNKHLSAKTTKGDGKVAPQVIGQAQPVKFCEELSIPVMDVPTLKRYIQENIAAILKELEEHTFDCPIVYYNKKTDTIRYITRKNPIDWTAYTYKWTQNYDTWANSSTLKIVKDGKETSILEIQFHTKSRTNMAVRWCFEEYLRIFADQLDILLI